MDTNVSRALEHLRGWFHPDGDRPTDPGSAPRDPYASRPVPRKPAPHPRAGSAAVAEPDDD